MSGLTQLVPLAELMEQLRGGKEGAMALAVEIVQRGPDALPTVRDDLTSAIREEVEATGVLRSHGGVDLGRASELVSVCSVLAAATPPAEVRAAESGLYLSGPLEAVAIEDGERLESFVLDVIRGATESLVIGGAFWNSEGFDILAEVLAPALSVRAVPTTIYANVLSQARNDFTRRVAELAAHGPVTVKFFVGREPTMLHAKFVIRDQVQGYLGTANLTSWGMQGHIEAGVELSPGQCRRLLSFLDELEEGHLFVDGTVATDRVGN